MRLLARPLRGWRPALRIARREALRARGRSALVLVMIGLPVLGIVCLDTLARTQDVNAVEGLDRQLGSADALVTYDGDSFPVDQSPTLSARGSLDGVDRGEIAPPTTADVRRVLGPRARVLETVDGRTAVRTSAGVARPDALGLDLHDPMTRGLLDLVSGRYPRTTHEVAVSGRLADRGFPVGSSLTLGDGRTRRVVGLVESSSVRGLNLLAGQPAAVGLDAGGRPGTESVLWRSWLVARPGGVDWSAVRDLNAHGMYALSRQVVEHPPPASAVTMQTSGDGGPGAATVATLGLIVAMALLEVVLLAGPAFAVGARRQQRALALMAAGGAEAPHLRRMVLATGVVLGGAASVTGAVAGVGVAWLAAPAVQRIGVQRFGPFDTSVRDIVVIAACGLLSALLAALAPAVMAARQDVVAVLAGRRGQGRPTRWSPVLGTVLLALGVAGAVFGARRPHGGEVAIALSAVLAVVGVVLLAPLAVSQLGRAARLLPLPAKFALRDAARHRSRTAPAVAAVAASVAGVVALGIGGTSDAAQGRAMYTPAAPDGAGVVQASGAEAASWPAFADAIRSAVPDAAVTTVRGLPEDGSDQYRLEPVAGDRSRFGSYSGSVGSSFLVGRSALTALRLSPADERRAESALRRGELVVLDPRSHGRGQVTLAAERYAEDGSSTTLGTWRRRALFVAAPGTVQPARAVLPATLATATHLPVAVVGLVVGGATIDQGTEDRLDESLAALDQDASLYVERGYRDDGTQVVLLILSLVGGALVLGGTLTATFLALSDARPDFATLGAVGAAPRTRQLVAASYAAGIGLLGAVLGAVVGFVPGIAVTFPLTSRSWTEPGATTADGNPIPGHVLDVPWLLVAGLVVALPLVTAVVVGLVSRSRLPMVSRLA